MTQLVTGDAVLLDLRPARVPTRMLAVALDLVLVGAATWGWWYVVNRLGGSEARQRAVTVAGGLIINFGYLITMETLTRGRTVGMFALGLRAVRDDGGALRFRQALLRGLAFWLVDFAPWTGLCAGVICATVNTDSKRLGDLLAGTIVIRTRAPRAPAAVPPVPEELRTWAAQLELSGLPDELVTAARHLLQRGDALADHPRRQVAADLARQVAGRIAPPPPAGLPPLDFLAAVVAERRQRAGVRPIARTSVPAAEQLPPGWR